ncbi:SDR family NAD(P)-dependent oxidoreductase [Gordonia polyisoprenivorans]|uniref:SDR family NAD(P)-dependent oxidoreductase n=1 Tax=Gordonia polyisoprenivorans TaxID=84595 RepID=UPI0023004D34|nr:type I polyketide synthase [Gordonia polyisoprenivorans]WCB39586.1 SDR family NAD(P)-dependent oxidoreductase [Gordonia polyisoprenivorans]
MSADDLESVLRDWLTTRLAALVDRPASDIDPTVALADLGLGSRDSVMISGELTEFLGRQVSPVEFWEHPTIDALVAHLCLGDHVEPQAASAGRSSADDGPIAVVGIGCRFPGGIGGPDEYWQFLCADGDAVTTVPRGRWDRFDDGRPEVVDALASTTRHGAFLDDVEGFDADFFEITAREAAKMDPQQRLMLEVVWEALEHAGIRPESLRRTPTGVFVGACAGEYGYLASTDLPTIDAWSNLGAALSIIANRLSYVLDLRGPSLTIDTACSSSLVAIHLATQSLRSGEADVAIAGGVNLLLTPAVFAGFDQSGALSPTGACHAFDAAADGFVRGEGAGAVILKRLDDALTAGDRILAVIRGTAVNQDGHSNGLFAPNPAAQMEVLRTAYSRAGVGVREIDYVETHGTGTLLGDPIEARALGTVLGRGRPADAPLLLGAVKTNLGHLEAAAGIAGFIKTVLACSRGTIPATLHQREPNPHIPFDQLRLQVVDTKRAWPATGRPRRAGVSSFGFGGTNAHIVVEQAPVVHRDPAPADTFTPAVSTLVLSGRSAERVADIAGTIADWMITDGAGIPVPDIAHTLNHHRAVLPVTATVTARDRAGAIAGLHALAGAGTADADGALGVTPPRENAARTTGTVFVYSGQGSQWPGMAAVLLADEPAFADAVDEMEGDFLDHVGFSLRNALTERRDLHGDAEVQPVLMGLQVALTRLWAHHGVHPDAVIGQSMGEVSAAVVAGMLTVAEGLAVIGIRSRLMSAAPTGGVAVLRLSGDEVTARLAAHPGVEIAGRLAPRQTVVAGPPEAVDAVLAEVLADGVFARRVAMTVASHTALMDPLLGPLRSALADLTPRPARIPFLSTVHPTSGDAAAPVVDADYWADNLRMPVQLAQAVARGAAEYATFVEISPHPILGQALVECLEEVGVEHAEVLATLHRDRDDTVSFHRAYRAAAQGVPSTPHPAEPHPVLPRMPWRHTPFWLPTPTRADVSSGPAAGSPSFPVEGRVPGPWWHHLAWPAMPAPGTHTSTIEDPQHWVIVGDGLDSGSSAVLRAALPAGSQITELALDAITPDTDDSDMVSRNISGADRVVFAPATEADPFAARPAYRLFSVARRLVAAAVSSGTRPRLHLITRNGAPLADGDHAVPAHAALWGLGRTLALEYPEIWGGVLDVDASVPGGVVARYLLDEIGADDHEDQVVYRAGTRHVPRLRAGVRSPDDVGGEPITGQTHLVVGATGHIGPHLIAHLADRGAHTVVAVSRTPGTRLDPLVAELGDRGCRVVVVAADATDETAMAALFARFGTDLPALDGVHLAAFGGGPVTLTDMTDEDVAAMFGPKLDALAVLHRMTLTFPVSRFVVFSSISGLLGSRWLAHYAATTTFLDAFVHARRTAGLPATTVNWGLWKSLADHQDSAERQVTAESGLIPMDDRIAIDALTSVTGPGTPARAIVVDADWELLGAAYRTRTALHIVDEVMPAAGDGTDRGAITEGDTAFRRELRDADPSVRLSLLADRVADLVAKVMGLTSPAELDRSAGFFQFGMDSLMSVTLQRALSESLGELLPTSVVFDHPTVDALTDHLAATLPETADLDTNEPDDGFDELSEDELLQALSERLG